jgi:hypothetical protein
MRGSWRTTLFIALPPGAQVIGRGARDNPVAGGAVWRIYGVVPGQHHAVNQSLDCIAYGGIFVKFSGRLGDVTRRMTGNDRRAERSFRENIFRVTSL